MACSSRCLLSLNIGGAALRVGQQVLSRGDTVSPVIALPGKPDFRPPVEQKFDAHAGARWPLNRKHRHVLTITLINGKFADIEDRHD